MYHGNLEGIRPPSAAFEAARERWDAQAARTGNLIRPVLSTSVDEKMAAMMDARQRLYPNGRPERPEVTARQDRQVIDMVTGAGMLAVHGETSFPTIMTEPEQ